MKAFNLIVALFISSLAFAQPNMDISMIRGLGNTCAWETAVSQLAPSFTAGFSTEITGGSNTPIENHFINYGAPLNTVVGHSMGGLVARSEILEGDVIENLITIGTPHLGAPIAAMGTNIGVLAPTWINDILAAPCAEWGGIWCGLTNDIVQELAINLLPAIIQQTTPIGNVATNQMIPGSNFLNNLNGNFANSIPPLENTFFILGTEDYQHHFRLMSSTLNDCDPENGVVATASIVTGVIYYIIAIYRYYDALAAQSSFLQTGDVWYLFQADNLFAKAQLWLRGASSLMYWQQAEWSRFIDGSFIEANGDWWVSDGVVPAFSQVGLGLMPPDRILVSELCNHNEETKHPNAIQVVQSALVSLGVN